MLCVVHGWALLWEAVLVIGGFVVSDVLVMVGYIVRGGEEQGGLVVGDVLYLGALWWGM